MNKVSRWVFRYVVNKTFDFSSKKKDFLPKNDQIWPKTGIFGQFGPGRAGLFSALLVGGLVVVARGLYLARHLFTLYRDVKRKLFRNNNNIQATGWLFGWIYIEMSKENFSCNYNNMQNLRVDSALSLSAKKQNFFTFD